MSYNDADTFLPHGPAGNRRPPARSIATCDPPASVELRISGPMAPAGIVGGGNGSGSVVAVVMIIEDEDQVRVLVESDLQDHGHYSPSPTL